MWPDTFLIMKGPSALILQLLLGLSVLLFGRKIFWLFVGVVGFVAGAWLAALLFQGHPGWPALLFAAACGIAGALLAVLLQRLSIALSGFLAGGYVAAVVLHHLGWVTGIHFWVPFLAGGILGALLMSVIFDPALVVLSSLLGAALIVLPFHLVPLEKGLIFIVLALAGITAQAAMMKRSSGRPT